MDENREERFYDLLEADENDAEAQYQIGLCYLNGDGTDKDTQKAETYFRRASELGHAAAAEMLGKVAVPRRGASCYGKNAKNTMQIFGILTIFLYYLLYFCVSIRDIVGFPRCEPACNNLIYCYYNTRFAPNQPVPKPSSIATGCKTRWHKL